MSYEFAVVAVGGTFDRLHAGHRKLLETAFETGERVLIGLTSDELVRALQKSHPVDPYRERERELLSFLRERGLLARAEVVPLHDAYGLTTTDPSIEALIVTPKTAERVEEINSIRASKGFRPIKPILVSEVLAEDLKPISSTRVRRGEIDREGRLPARSRPALA
ncbi:MAG: phosphopantetheine adenylyltransferase [Candidatus Bathyarchaeia archaeon]